jgi:hypothetical protein
MSEAFIDARSAGFSANAPVTVAASMRSASASVRAIASAG